MASRLPPALVGEGRAALVQKAFLQPLVFLISGEAHPGMHEGICSEMEKFLPLSSVSAVGVRRNRDKGRWTAPLG
jgi:hypothetical protein